MKLFPHYHYLALTCNKDIVKGVSCVNGHQCACYQEGRMFSTRRAEYGYEDRIIYEE